MELWLLLALPPLAAGAELGLSERDPECVGELLLLWLGEREPQLLAEELAVTLEVPEALGQPEELTEPVPSLAAGCLEALTE